MDEIRTMPFGFQTDTCTVQYVPQCNGDKIESAPSRFHDCKGQVRGDRQNDYDRHVVDNKFTNCAIPPTGPV